MNVKAVYTLIFHTTSQRDVVQWAKCINEQNKWMHNELLAQLSSIQCALHIESERSQSVCSNAPFNRMRCNKSSAHSKCPDAFQCHPRAKSGFVAILAYRRATAFARTGRNHFKKVINWLNILVSGWQQARRRAFSQKYHQNRYQNRHFAP